MNTIPAIGSRIRQARVAAGLSLRELACRAAPLSATAVSRFEQGVDTPRPATLQRLARALQVPTSFFFRQVTIQLDCPHYRGNSQISARAQAMIEEQVKARLERYVEVEALFSPDRFEKPCFDQRSRRRVSHFEQAEDIAAALRAQWELGKDPIENVAEALEDRGVKVLLIQAPASFNGLACWANHTIPVIVANACKAWDHQRFNLVHELGNLILDPAPEMDFESAADRFAAAFLVPIDMARRELGDKRGTLTINELQLLRMKYGLSIQGWVRRAYDAQIITGATFRRLFRTFSALEIRRNESGHEDSGRAPDPARRFELLVRQAAAEGLITPAREAELLDKPLISTHPRISADRLRSITISTASQADLTADDHAWLDFSDGEFEDE